MEKENGYSLNISFFISSYMDASGNIGAFSKGVIRLIIQNSNISMEATRSYRSKSTNYSSYTTRNMSNLFLQRKMQPNLTQVDTNEKLEQIRQIQQNIIDYLMKMLFGDKFEPAREMNTTEQFVYNSYFETEETSFSSTGTVKTADGRNIDFQINVNMSRSFSQIYAQQITLGKEQIYKDPLVINLNENIASVSDQTFFFDIDADGIEDEISMLDSQSGYLALDKNEDGTINDGSELFGTQSGNGFADLAGYDEDGNGWIDEADSIFAKLKVWVMEEDGKSKLYSLKEAGVGALYLGNEVTDFSLKDAYNNTNAVIRRTGMFLYENGGVGTLQQLDLTT